MANVALEPTSRRPHAELAEILSAGYEGYYTPFAVDEASFRFMSTVWDDDLDASRVAIVDGEPAGICEARDPWRPRAGSPGSASQCRAPRQGHRRGTDARRPRRGACPRARRRSASRCSSRTSQRSELYEKLGFERVRELEVWTLEPPPPEQLVFSGTQSPWGPGRAGAGSDPPASGREREPWQRADESVANLRGRRGDRETSERSRSTAAPKSGSRCSRASPSAAPQRGSCSRDFRPRRPWSCG